MLDKLVRDLVSTFPGVPSIESITKGRDFMEVYGNGEFCGYCPALIGCDNDPARKYRKEPKKDRVNELLDLLMGGRLRRFLGMFMIPSEIDRIAGTDGVVASYEAGKYCEFCPAFGDCHNDPALKSRAKLN